MAMQSKHWRTLYWVVTLLFLNGQVWSATEYLVEAPRMVETIQHLGYPLYFVKMLAVAKLLGAAAILYNRWPVLKEWAYAGFMFDVLGAFVSHLSVGDPFVVALVPLAFLALQAISYFVWKRYLLKIPAARERADRDAGYPPIDTPEGAR